MEEEEEKTMTNSVDQDCTQRGGHSSRRYHIASKIPAKGWDLCIDNVGCSKGVPGTGEEQLHNLRLMVVCSKETEIKSIIKIIGQIGRG